MSRRKRAHPCVKLPAGRTVDALAQIQVTRIIAARLRLLLQLLLTLNATDGVAADGTPSTTDSFIILLPGFFAALLILGVDEVARWVVLAVVNEPTGRL